MIQLIFLSTFPKHLPFAGNGKKFLVYMKFLSSYTREDPSHKIEKKKKKNIFLQLFYFGCVGGFISSSFPFFILIHWRRNKGQGK